VHPVLYPARDHFAQPEAERQAGGKTNPHTGNRGPAARGSSDPLRELEPGVAEVHANLGVIYFQEMKFEQAVPTLRQALKLKPALTKTAALLAMSHSELGRYGEALPGLEKGFSPVYRPSHQAHVRPTVAQGLHRAAARQQCGGSSPGAESALSQ
jgi:tetratricopeptide (TPR) repeat protein